MPLVIRGGGCLYALASAKNQDAARWPPSSIFLQPYVEADGSRANQDLFLFHPNTYELQQDWRHHKQRFAISDDGAL